MKVVDLRSDTVTRPTEQMRAAMAAAEVGDDVFGEDPTVNELQDRVAKMCGGESALYVPSGSMGNLVSLRAWAQPGDEVICHEGAHFLHYEVGAVSAVAGVMTRPLPGVRGVLDPVQVDRAIRPNTYTFPRSAVIALENTHNSAGGAIYPLEDMRGIRKVADEHSLKIHLDGARIFNACVATGVEVGDYFSLVDSMSFCFSKGLGCPVGSIVVGPSEFIEKAHRYRKMHGGGMRQAGVLAAACIVALDTMVDRLADDHTNARRLADGIAALRPQAVNPSEVETNILFVDPRAFGHSPGSFAEALKDAGVLFLPAGAGSVRLVTHADVASEDIDYVLEQFAKVA